jgi:hypothetical protein
MPAFLLDIRDGRGAGDEPGPFLILSSVFEGEQMDEAMELALVLRGRPVRPVCVMQI